MKYCVPSSLQNNIPGSTMTRRNTYVCTDRSSTDRHSLLQNGKDNRWQTHTFTNTVTLCHCAAYCSALSGSHSLSVSVSPQLSVSPPPSHFSLHSKYCWSGSIFLLFLRWALSADTWIHHPEHLPRGSAPWPCTAHLWTSAHVAHPQSWCWSAAAKCPQPGHF